MNTLIRRIAQFLGFTYTTPAWRVRENDLRRGLHFLSRP